MSSNSPGRSSPTSSNTNLASSNSPTQLITTAPAVPPVSAAIPVPIVECKDVRAASSNLSTATSSSSLSSSAPEVDSDAADAADKVGLTGFECRCGGLYCSVHRYSDKHECSFNYRELGAEEIRRNNPVVVGQKIQKI